MTFFFLRDRLIRTPYRDNTDAIACPWVSELFWLYVVVGTSPRSIVLRQNPPGNWVILIFSGQKPCIRIIYSILQSFLHFWRTRENECQISQNYILRMKFSEFYPCFHSSCETWLSFDSRKKFCLVLLQITDYIFNPSVKKNAIFFKLFWYNVFVHWELNCSILVDSVLRLMHEIYNPLVRC